MNEILKKWEIKKNGIDDYVLNYKDKSLPFHSNVGIVEKLQNTLKIARLNMIKELAEQGMTINDLTKVTTKDGKTFYDNSNKQYMEEAFIIEANKQVLEDIMKNTFSVSFEELIIDMELDENEIQEFTNEIARALIGQTPR